MVSKAYVLGEKLFWKCVHSDDDAITDAESVVVMVFMSLAFMQGAKDFQVFFEDGFDAKCAVEAFEMIGHKRAAYTLKLAHRIWLISPSDETLEFLGFAFIEMERTILRKLEAYAIEHSISIDTTLP